MKRNRTLSLVLTVVMILSTAVIPTYAESEIQYTEADLHEMITYADAVAAGHVNRLNDEEDMNTLIFANADNTKTMYYYGEDIKYTDENGTVRDKTNELTYKNGVYINEDNDINVALPKNLSSGVTLTYNDIEITMTPEFVGAGSLTDSAPTASLDSTPRGQADTVMYNAVFGIGTSIRYTPMYSGIKEDIILSSYTGEYTFDFMIETSGLIMLPDTVIAEAVADETELDGSIDAEDNLTLAPPPNWYFATREDPLTPVATLSDIYIYDSAGNTALGSVDVTETANGEYLLTVVADKAFLEAESTVYPVTVDPTVTLNGTINSKKYIEDSFISSANPTTNYGSITSVHANTERSIFLKFPGLSENQQMVLVQGSKIARFYLRFYSTGVSTNASTASYSVYNVNATWNENTITYNNKPSCGSSSLNTSTVTGTAGYKTIDVSNAARQWATISQKAAYFGVKLTFADSMKFYSSEVAIDSYKPYLLINYDATGEGIYKIKNVGTDKYLNVHYDDGDKNVYCATSSDCLDQYVRLENSTQNAYIIYTLRRQYGTDSNLCVSSNNVTISTSDTYWKLACDESGNFTIQEKSDGKYLTANSGEGSLNNTATTSNGNIWVGARNTNKNQVWTLDYIKDTYEITVTVKDSEGEYIEGAQIEISTDENPNKRQTVTLNNTGPTTILLLNKDHGINAKAAGYAKQYCYQTSSDSSFSSAIISSSKTLYFTLIPKSNYPTLGWPIIASATTNEDDISSKYGYRCYDGTDNYPEIHKGLDLSYSGIENDQIKSVSDGSVTFSGWSEGAGYVVRVKFNYNGITYYVSYKHLAEQSALGVNDPVSPDTTIIGKVGNTNYTVHEDMGSHLHIDFYYLDSSNEKVYVDPQAFFEN